jgi:BlaI family transcriptional regulator, penicillinase repressor
VSSSGNLARPAGPFTPLEKIENGAGKEVVEKLAGGNGTPKGLSPRRSLLDLAPLELDCMATLWPLGQATVREIREALAPRRARAYTTIMTIMDRLARKGIVERSKSGRAYVYRPRLTAEDARSQALAQVLDKFFGGSHEALLAQLTASARNPAGSSQPAAAQHSSASDQ